MAQAPRDQNNVTAGLGVSETDGVTTIPFYVDSLTGRVLLSISSVSEAGGVVADNLAERDQNNVPTMLATFSDDSGIGIPAIDNRNGYLYFDITS